MRILPPEPAQAYSPACKPAAAAGTAAQTRAPISSQDPIRNADTLFVILFILRKDKLSRTPIIRQSCARLPRRSVGRRGAPPPWSSLSLTNGRNHAWSQSQNDWRRMPRRHAGGLRRNPRLHGAGGAAAYLRGDGTAHQDRARALSRREIRRLHG